MQTFDKLTKEEILDDLIGKDLEDYNIYEFDKNKNVFTIGKNGKYGLINSYGKVILPTFFTKEKIDSIKKVINEPQNPIIENSKDITYNKFMQVELIKLNVDYDEYTDFIGDFSIVKKNNKFAIIDKNFKLITSFIYDEIVYVNEKLLCIKIDNKWGFIDKYGKTIIEPKYESYGEFYDSYFKDAILNGKKIYLYIDNSSDKIKIHELDSVFYMNENVSPILKDNKWGYIKKNGEIIVKPKYEEASIFSGGMGVVKEKNKYGFVDLYGNEKITCIYDDAHIFSCGYAAVKLNQKWGFIDAFGNEKTKFIYDYVSDFVNGFARVRIGMKNNVIDINFKNRFKDIPVFIREYVSDAHNDHIIYKQNRKYGYMYLGNNKDIAKEILPKFDVAYDFNTCFAKVKIDNKFGIISENGKFVTPRIFDSIEKIEAESLSAYSIYDDNEYKNGYFYIDSKNKKISILPYSSVTKIGDNLKVSININEKKRYGIVNNKNETIIPLEYDDINYISENYLKLFDGTNYKIVDIKNCSNTEYSNEYEDIIFTNNNLVFLKKNGKYSLATKELNLLTKYIFDNVSEFNENVAQISINGKSGYLNQNGDYKLLDYDRIYQFENGYAIVEKDNKKTIIDLNLQNIIENFYDNIIKIDKDKLLIFNNEDISPTLLTFKCKDKYSNCKLGNGIYFKNDKVYSNDDLLFEIDSKMKVKNCQFKNSMTDTILTKVKKTKKNIRNNVC